VDWPKWSGVPGSEFADFSTGGQVQYSPHCARG